MNEAFGHWLAGFTDGEGAFVVTRVGSRNGNPHNRTWPNCRFEINLRADDMDVLLLIQAETGFGSISVHSIGKDATHPAVRWAVHRIGDCQAVVALFERYPLRAKKRAQFEVWSEAVREMAKGRGRDDGFIDGCRARLAELRRYSAPANLDVATVGNPEMLRHRVDYGTAPLCGCGCGSTTSLRNNLASLQHPDNPRYCHFVRGHHWRLKGTLPSAL